MNSLKLIPLGGIGDVTKNMYVYEIGNDQLIVDCGIGFPNNSTLGVDLVIPDIDYLEKNKKKIHGIVLTHSHQDHVGGLPYILPRLPNVPVYGSTLTIAMAEGKVREFGITNKMTAIEKNIRLGPFDIEMIHVTHSTPNCKHILIKTPAGTVYHGADFKFDLTPIDDQPADFTRIAAAGAAGVDLMLTDCLRIESSGFTPSERTLLGAVDTEFRQAQGKVIFTTISSSISRIDMAISAAVKYHRKVFLVGRSIKQSVEAAIKYGFLKVPNGTIVPPENVRHYKSHQVAIIIAGSQGQEGSAMHRLAAGEHKFIKLRRGDHVVISSDAIPGNESNVFGLIDTLYKQDITVAYSGTSENLHVSGHGHRGDLSLLARLVKPRHIIPIGGNLRHMVLYQKYAKDLGYSENQVHVLEDGQIMVLENHTLKKGEKIETKNVYVDGLGIGDVGSVVLRDRQVMSSDGMLIAIVPIAKDSSKITGEVEIVSRGFVYVKESKELIKEIKSQVNYCMKGQKGLVTDWSFIRDKIEQTLERFIYEKTQRRPLILAVVIEV
jgi:ribonuclease J